MGFDTTVPRPRRSMRPSTSSSCRAWRTVSRATPNRAASSRSGGNASPSTRSSRISSSAVRTRYGLLTRAAGSIRLTPLPHNPFRDGQHVVDCRRRVRLGILRGVVVAPQPQRVGPPGWSTNAASTPAPPCACSESHRTSDSVDRVAGFGGHQVALGGDVRAGQPADPLAEPRRQPVLGGRVVLRRPPTSPNSGLCAEIVQRGGEHQFVVGAVVDGAGRGLQRVVEFVDGLLVPHAAQRAQQVAADFHRARPRLQHTRNWSIPIVNLLFRRGNTAASAGRIALSLKGHCTCE